MKPKLLVVTSTFPRWKDDTDPPFVYELSRRLTSDFDVTVHTPHYPGAALKEEMDGMKVHRFRYFFLPFEKLAGEVGILPTLRYNKGYCLVVPFFLLFQLISLLRLVYAVRPDVIHAHWIIPQGIVAVIVRLFMRVPVVVTAHGGDVFGLQGTVASWIKQFVLKYVQSITTVSRSLAQAISTLLPRGRKAEIIPMGVDANVFAPEYVNGELKEKYGINGPFLLYVGRLTEKKGVHYLLDAMSEIIHQYSDAKLLVIGSGELRASLERKVEKMGLYSCTCFIDGLPQAALPEFYATADIFIGPSIAVKNGDTEGFGLTFVEAAMSGCHVIASDIGGIPDIIIHGETGFLVPPGDSQSIADTVIRLLQNPHAYKDIPAKSRLHCIERFDWARIANRYSLLLSESAKRKH